MSIGKSTYIALAVLAGLLLWDVQALAAPERAVSETLQERVINLASNVSLRLTAATGRFGDIVARLETRIEKFKLEGVDTAPAEAKLTEAKHVLVSAIIALDGLPSAKAAVSGDTPREAMGEIRVQIMAIRDDLGRVQTLLRETIALLKEALRNAEAEKGVSGAVTDSADGE